MIFLSYLFPFVSSDSLEKFREILGDQCTTYTMMKMKKIFTKILMVLSDNEEIFKVNEVDHMIVMVSSKVHNMKNTKKRLVY